MAAICNYSIVCNGSVQRNSGGYVVAGALESRRPKELLRLYEYEVRVKIYMAPMAVGKATLELSRLMRWHRIVRFAGR